ncbi:hypothetical protein KIN20_010148 [Parelaphostrongylus tenuis]|uniref:Uncharacterized protein n=1 Tax=Parelaphostrongylus tenuis TaxID=148309 RepID=A0AAD5M7G6_PARTN|nr:hypothetical protein KIN20_010148 [Parelaphostrongylus tenuis]
MFEREAEDENENEEKEEEKEEEKGKGDEKATEMIRLRSEPAVFSIGNTYN